MMVALEVHQLVMEAERELCALRAAKVAELGPLPHRPGLFSRLTRRLDRQPVCEAPEIVVRPAVADV